jgi:hypothetical protein
MPMIEMIEMNDLIEMIGWMVSLAANVTREMSGLIQMVSLVNRKNPTKTLL